MYYILSNKIGYDAYVDVLDSNTGHIGILRTPNISLSRGSIFSGNIRGSGICPFRVCVEDLDIDFESSSHAHGDVFDRQRDIFVLAGCEISVYIDGENLHVGDIVVTSGLHKHTCIQDIICTGYVEDECIWQCVCLLSNLQAYALYFSNGLCIGVSSLDMCEVRVDFGSRSSYIAEQVLVNRKRKYYGVLHNNG